MSAFNGSVQLPALVVTDLDGTLLDHHTYDWRPARDALEKLEALNIPVIFNTSKTRAELEYWRRETGNHHPFIVENGSAIFIPSDYPKNTGENSDCKVIELGTSRTEILAWLQQQPEHTQAQFQHFAQLDTHALVALTDLPETQAELALQREYSEAIHWRGDKQQREAFIHAARDNGYRVLIGGRFLHILGPTDKGRASRVLLETMMTMDGVFAFNHPGRQPVSTIACGDSDNDIDMLEWADVAVVIRSPTKPPPTINNHQLCISEQPGPNGWSEVINKIHFTVRDRS